MIFLQFVDSVGDSVCIYPSVAGCGVDYSNNDA